MWFLFLLLGELHLGGGVSIPEGEGVIRDAAVQDATSSTPAAQPAWSFDVVPYYWSASLSGSLAIDGEEVDLEDGGDGFFGDPALSGFLGHFEAQHGPWSFVLAPIFVQADMHGEQAPATDADLMIHAQVHEAFVAREIVPGFEWMLGARYQELETDMDLSVAGQPIGSHDSTRSWVDPIVGVRYHSTLGGNWSLNARGDIGGFGVGSDLAWNASAMVGYQISSLVRLHLGYRALNVDFEDGGDSQRLAYDLSMYGPILGVAFSF